MAHSTMLGSQLVGDLIQFMIFNDIRKQVVPQVPLPVRLHQFPIEVARFSKVLQVIQTMADEQDDNGTSYAFSILDHGSQRFYRANFTLDPQTRNLTITVDPEDDLEDPDTEEQAAPE